MKNFTLGVAALLVATVGTAIAQPPFQASEEHKQIASEVGTWNATLHIWMTPDQQQPLSSKGKEVNRLMGPFWLVSDFTGNVAGAEFSGRGQFGYDPVGKKYIGTWIDTMTPYMASMEGDYDAETKTLTMVSTARDPMTGEIATSTNVTKFVDENTKVFTMYRGGPDDEDRFKMMEIEYKRADEKVAENEGAE